jgi:hypothetical protein
MGMVRTGGILLTVAVLAGGCGGQGGGQGGGKTIPAAAAGVLAGRADRVAADLAAGACDQARAEAQSLQADLAALPVDPAVRDQAVAGAARLVATIACAAATTTTITTVPTLVVAPPRGDPGHGKGKKDKGGDHDD